MQYFIQILIFVSWEEISPFTNASVYSGLKIATDMVANATNIFSLATKNAGLVATLVTRILYDSDLY